MMTACDLSAITKPWEVQSQASPIALLVCHTPVTLSHACDLSAIIKPWEVQSGKPHSISCHTPVCHHQTLGSADSGKSQGISFLDTHQALPRSHGKPHSDLWQPRSPILIFTNSNGSAGHWKHRRLWKENGGGWKWGTEFLIIGYKMFMWNSPGMVIQTCNPTAHEEAEAGGYRIQW